MQVFRKTGGNTMSKRTGFYAGMFTGVLIAFIAFRGGDMYNKFSPNGYYAFQIAIPNSLLKTAVVSPHDIRALAYTFNEAAIFATAHAVDMKDNSGLKKLDMLLGLFIQHDDEYYEKWFKKHKLFF